MKNIAIIEGGYSHEKVISLQSAQTVFDHIDTTRFKPYKVRIDEEGWFVYEGESKFAVNRSDFSHNGIPFDFAFIVIHGTPGEDGKLQAYFDMLGVPYSTCDHFSATLTFNKYACNQFLKGFGVKVAEAVLIRKGQSVDSDELISSVGLPCFVKPNDGGSSFGVTKVTDAQELTDAISLALKHGSQAIVEAFLSGREVTNGIFSIGNEIHSLPITEIVTNNDFFDFDAKYKGESNEITPADLPIEMEEKVKAETKRIFELLGLDGICRADYILQNNEPYFIEINTVPGLSAASLIPQMAAHANIELKQLFNNLIEMKLS